MPHKIHNRHKNIAQFLFRKIANIVMGLCAADTTRAEKLKHEVVTRYD